MKAAAPSERLVQLIPFTSQIYKFLYQHQILPFSSICIKSKQVSKDIKRNMLDRHILLHKNIIRPQGDKELRGKLIPQQIWRLLHTDTDKTRTKKMKVGNHRLKNRWRGIQGGRWVGRGGWRRQGVRSGRQTLLLCNTHPVSRIQSRASVTAVSVHPASNA